jgi:hypothetical protein
MKAHPYSIEAIAKTVDGEISASLLSIDSIIDL